VQDEVDIAIVGAGAAGIMAAIWGGRTAIGQGKKCRIVALDGARTLGAKILVAGGGRCNVTHDRVDESDYAGSTRPAIRRVLQRFDVSKTVAFFEEAGVKLKKEETGKLFPVTDRARTVLDALLKQVRDAGAEIMHPWRVRDVRSTGGSFEILPDDPDKSPLRARKVILATGGCALPRTGSDGHGYAIARSLGHSMTSNVFPSLVPLTLPHNHFLCSLSGVAVPATVELRSGTGKRMMSVSGAVLCTHFGLSGPAILDISRYLTEARLAAREQRSIQPRFIINWLADRSPQSFEAELLEHARTGGRDGVGRLLQTHLPERVARALCENVGIDPAVPPHSLTREQRKALVATVCELEVPITGDRGYTFAEATAGGVPLAEVNLKTMESRICSGLFLCGEIMDVDGRIGGFNFQWAWASGYVAGSAAAESLKMK
jgi:predicted Rossmann fold flavoprotein